jgi:tRNA (guanine37-N1)-methyltransferase
MVMMAEPILKAVEKTLRKITNLLHRQTSYESASSTDKLRIKNSKIKKYKPKVLIVNFIPSSEKFTTSEAKKISKKYTDVILICGRYEGIDARVDKILKTKKYSIGDYVLTGGEIPAMVLIDSISRQIKGVLGNLNSLEEERVSSSEIYTRPEVIEHKNKKYRVPKVLLGGNHKEIETWKNKLK